jgi:hypothetical protein
VLGGEAEGIFVARTLLAEVAHRGNRIMNWSRSQENSPAAQFTRSAVAGGASQRQQEKCIPRLNPLKASGPQKEKLWSRVLTKAQKE